MARETDILVRIGLRDTNSGQVLKNLQSRIIRFVGAVTASVAAVKAITFPIAQAAAFERELKNVQKTTGFTDRDINQLSGSLLDLSRNLGISGTELAQISAIAGQLGLGEEGRESVVAFTEAVAEASVALGDSVEKTAEYTAQLASIFKIPIEDVKKITGVLNEVSNSSVATGAQLADIGKRVGDTAGLALTETIALAGYVRELGVPVEQAGTGIVNSFVNIQTKTSQVLDLLKTDTETWAETLRTSPVEAIKQVAKAISEIESQSLQAEAIKDLFGTGRQFALAQKIVADAVNDFAKLDQLLAKSNEEFKVGTSATKEYKNIMEALVGQAQLLRAAFESLVTKAGLGAIEPLVDATQRLADALNSEAAKDFAEGAAKALADIVSVTAEFIAEITESRDAFFEFLDAIQAVGKVIVAYFAGKVLASIGRLAANLTIAFAKLALGIRGAFTKVPATGLFATLANLKNSANVTAAATDRMRVSFAASLTAVNRDITVMVGLLRQVVAQLDALIIKLQASQILANRLAASSTAAIGATTALGTAAAAGAAGTAGAKAAQGATKAGAALKGATVASTGFLASLKGIGKFIVGGLSRIFAGFIGFLLGPWSAAILTVISLWPLFGDTIKEVFRDAINVVRKFFGLQALEQEESTRKTKEWTREQREAAEEAYAAYESAAARFKKEVPKPFTTVGDLVDDAGIRGDAEETARVYQKLFDKIKSIGGVLEDSTEALAKNSAEMGVQQARLLEVAGELDELIARRKAFEDFQKFGFKVEGFSGGAEEAAKELAQLDGAIQAAEYRYKNLEGVISGLKTIQDEWTETLKQSKQASNDPQFLQNVAAYFDEQTLAYAKSRLQVLSYSKDLEAIEKELETVRKVAKKAAEDKDPNLNSYLAAQEALRLKRIEIAALSKEENEQQEEALKLVEGRGEAERSYNIIQKQGQKGLEQTIALLENVKADGFLKAGNAIAESFRDARTSVEALTQYRLLQKLKEDIEDASKAMEHYAKVAQSAFDNTFVELSAVERKFREFQKSLVFDQIDFEIDIKYNRDKLDKLESDFDKRRDRIKEKYDTILDTAIPSQRRYWELRQEAELQSLDNEEKVKKAQLERARLQETFNRYAAQTAEFFEAAKSATNVNEFLALKNQGKEGLAALQEVVREAQQLESVDVFGKTKGAFSGNEIQGFVSKLRELTTESQSNIKAGNRNIRDVTKESEAAYSKIAKSISDAAKDNETIVNQLRQIFPDIDKVLKSMDEVKLPAELDKATKSLNQAIAGLNTASFQGLGTDLQLPDLSNQLTAVRENTSEALKVAAEDGLSRVEFGKLTAPLEATATEATAAGAKAGIERGGAEAQVVIPSQNVAWDSEGRVFDVDGKMKVVDIEVASEAEAKLKTLLTIPASIGKNARGGYIAGPGTGTSDSILSWLSNGEYVLDAFTTRFFGSGFFSSLQMYARSGRKPKIPGFAGGGQAGGAALAAVNNDVVNINLNLGNSTYSLFGEREQVRNLASAMKRLERGA